MDLNRVSLVDDRVVPRRALVSVAEKDGIAEFVAELWDTVPGLIVYSTGGTYRLLHDVARTAGKSDQLVAVSAVTGQPEMQGGLVKTLDFRLYLGLLSETYNTDHQRDLERAGTEPIDLTVCNFYPFEKIAADATATVEDLRTHIDIGGPTMVRASAKNFLRVATLTNPEDYQPFLAHLRANDGATTLAHRAELASAAFRYTAHYEAAIAGMIGARVLHTTWPGPYRPHDAPDHASHAKG